MQRSIGSRVSSAGRDFEIRPAQHRPSADRTSRGYGINAGCRLGTVVLACLLSLAILPGTVVADKPSAEPADEAVEEFVTSALTPFWKAKQLRESVFFYQGEDDLLPAAALLFKPTKLISVTSTDRKTAYKEGTDYVFDADTSMLTLPKDSRIPFKTFDQLHPLMTSDVPKIGKQRGDKTRGIFFDNGAGYHHLQIEVNYTCEPGQWTGPVPKFASASLPRTLAKLKNKEPIKIFLSGDSISEGYNATKFTKAFPGCPAYGELTALALQKHFGSEVTFKNYAVGGWQSNRGLRQAGDEKLGAQKPDLVIIAYGMNDVWGMNAEAYQKNVRDIMDTIRQDSPETEFILVASMLGNVEWGMPMEQFALYRDALKELCGPGVALADLTEIWEALLKRKSFYDLTGNGVNHPNDFGHCIYAQVVTSLLIDRK